ncbi:CopL family metal-binding regulatory protein [Thalassotalea sp. HSM 43]|uniref:CopL family metal-binding regulatory protein n=1 Tax=Thalassotalea sp. HSM 43 TaxID=2552945 RepID=UPI0010813ACD|nr:CopL family metal-binding regulatory protein [Thalassotalea sp. HSM 43]QBY03531.1 CopL family metal-binding regulatory protein [Thalassotalea sp. HSM 43]
MSFLKMFLCLVFVVAQFGQASAMQNHQCEQQTNTSSQMHMSHDMSHDMHQQHGEHHQMADADSQHNMHADMAMDCCGDDCACPSNACSSVVFILAQATHTDANIAPLKIRVADKSSLTALQTNLYRPPIIA